jgi:hypothetical protein
MDWHSIALIAAGATGILTAVFHGVLTERLMVKPLDGLMRADKRISGVIVRIVPILLHYSTASWLFCGCALIAAAFWLSGEALFVAALFVGVHYLYGAIGNFWATRGRQPGWILLGLAIGLIAYGVS